MHRYSAPDPDTRKPSFVPPPGACDCQLHIFGPPERYPIIAEPRYEPHFELGLNRARAMHAALGIERGVLVTATVYGTDNRVTVDALRQGGDRFRGIAVIAEDVTDAELDDMDRAGIRGIRFNFARFLGAAPSPDRFRRGVDRIAARGWHVVIHAQAEDLLEFESLFRAVEIPVVVDHMAHLDPEEARDRDALALLLDFLKQDTWWIKLSNADRISAAGPPYHDTIPLGRALAEAAPDRSLWGTDWPHVLYRKPVMVNDGDMLSLLAEFAPDEAARNRILVDNPARLYGFG